MLLELSSRAHLTQVGSGSRHDQKLTIILCCSFGFLAFADKQSADRAIAEADNSYWHGRRIAVQLRVHRPREVSRSARSLPPSSPTSSVYVGNIPYETTDSELNKMFRNLENVVDVRVAVDRNTGWPRGFAHADFTDVESATKALEFLSSQVLGGRKLRVDYSKPRTLHRRQPEQEGSSQEDGSRD
jgi:nucleolin